MENFEGNLKLNKFQNFDNKNEIGKILIDSKNN